MPKKRKVKKFVVVKAVKALARERIGTVPSGRVVPDGRKKSEKKHKPTLQRMLEGE